VDDNLYIHARKYLYVYDYINIHVHKLLTTRASHIGVTICRALPRRYLRTCVCLPIYKCTYPVRICMCIITVFIWSKSIGGTICPRGGCSRAQNTGSELTKLTNLQHRSSSGGCSRTSASRTRVRMKNSSSLPVPISPRNRSSRPPFPPPHTHTQQPSRNMSTVSSVITHK
jgi:hypothetical protein